jgi:hypothetical protein
MPIPSGGKRARETRETKEHADTKISRLPPLPDSLVYTTRWQGRLLALPHKHRAPGHRAECQIFRNLYSFYAFACRLLFMPGRRSLWRDSVDVTARHSSISHKRASRRDHHLQPRWVLLLPTRRGLQGHELFWFPTLGQVTARHHRSHWASADRQPSWHALSLESWPLEQPSRGPQ